MIAKIIVGFISFALGFLAKTYFFSAKERHDVKKDRRSHLNDMTARYHSVSEGLISSGTKISNLLDQNSIDEITVNQVFELRIAMDRYVQILETICGNEFDNHFQAGSFDREFLTECKKAAKKTIPSFYELNRLISEHHKFPFSDNIQDMCPNLLRILQGKLPPGEYQEIANVYGAAS